MGESNVFVYVIDENGFIVSSRIVDLNQRKLDSTEVSNTVLPVLYKPKWNGQEWIEGATQEENDELTKVEPTPPTEMDLLKAELTKTNEMLLDMMELLIGGM